MKHPTSALPARKLGLVTLAAVGLGGLIGAGPVEAASSVYKDTTSPIPANTYVYTSPLNHTANQIATCQSPTFSAAIYLQTTGGTQIRRADGNGPLYKGHAQENSTSARCWNKESSSKYAKCTHWYN